MNERDETPNDGSGNCVRRADNLDFPQTLRGSLSDLVECSE